MTTSNVNVERMDRLSAPDDYLEELPITPEATALVARTRKELEDIMSGKDDRMAMLVGPCSIHDEKAGLEYAQKLAKLADQVKDQILVVMRVYFEKPRTTVGWKGLINDPNLNGTFEVATGLRRGRKFLLQVAELGLASGTEFLDPFTPQYMADLVSWGAIGARTTESQTHRQMASGLSMPIGFKNGTGGTLQIAVDAMIAAESPHAFLGIDGGGRASVVHTTGNVGVHLILRGGSDGPNYDAESVAKATKLLATGGVSERLVVDCSHANSNKDHNRQPVVFRDVVKQRADGNNSVAGIMLESHLNPGAQKLVNGLEGLEYGVSITDACIDWATTEELLLEAQATLAGKVGASA
jgi:3-deoxy-7-phosphoheptulonate synthase